MAFYKCIGELPVGDASESDVLANKTFSNATGAGKVGTMPNRGNWSANLSTTSTSVTIPAGYHNGSGTVSIRTQEKTATLKNEIGSVDADPGYVLSKVIIPAVSTRLQEKTVNPTTSAVSVVPDNNYVGLSKVTVNPQVHDLVLAFPTGSGDLFDLGVNHRTRYVNGKNVKDLAYASGRLNGVEACHVKFCARYTKNTEQKTTDGWIHLDNLTSQMGGVTIITLSYNGYCYAPEIRAQRQDGAYRTWPSEYTFNQYMHAKSSDANAAQVWITCVRGTNDYHSHMRAYILPCDGEYPDQVYVLGFNDDTSPIIIEDP